MSEMEDVYHRPVKRAKLVHSNRSEERSSCSPTCSLPTQWSEEATKCVGNSSLQEVNKDFPHYVQLTPGIFREAIEKTLKRNCSNCFVALCKNNRRNIDLEFAYNRSAKERPHFISAVIREKLENGNADFYWSELVLLLDVVIKLKNWALLPLLFDVQMACTEAVSDRHIEECVVQFVLDNSSRTGIAPIVDLWIKKKYQTFQSLGVFVGILRTNLENASCSPYAVSGAKKWCVDNVHTNMAFLLALVFKDWDLAETVISMPSLTANISFSLQVVRLTARPEEGCSNSTRAAVLAACPITEENLGSYNFCFENENELSSVCEKRGLWDHALVLQYLNVNYVLNHYRLCQNRFVLDWILEQTVDEDESIPSVDLVLALLKDCTDAVLLHTVLHRAVCCGLVLVVEALLNQLDVSECIVDFSKRTLLFKAVSSCQSEGRKREIVRLLLSAGLSPFLRDVVTYEQTQFLMCEDDSNCCLEQTNRYNHRFSSSCPLQCAFLHNLPDLVDLTLACELYSHRTLNQVASSAEVQEKVENNDKLKGCFKRVQEAACTPTRLELLARLVVSRSVGCQPGREERIERLPGPPRLKSLVKFTDVL